MFFEYIDLKEKYSRPDVIQSDVHSLYRGITSDSNKWMNIAVAEACRSVEAGGGPFGAVVVQIDDSTNEVIRYWIAHNMVILENDPSAHAEVMAIRSACHFLGTHDLGHIDKSQSKLPQEGVSSHCEIYSSTEPCPMCYSTIYWARIPALFFGATRFDASDPEIGFSDMELYNDLKVHYNLKKMCVMHCVNNNNISPFELWKNKKDKKMY